MPFLCVDFYLDRLQDDFALDLLGELSHSSPVALNALQTMASLPIPDFALQVISASNPLAVMAHTSGAPVICYWSLQHIATFINGMQRVCLTVKSPQLRTAAFNGPQYWAPRSVSAVSSSKSRSGARSSMSASSAAPVITTNSRAMLRNSQVSLTGLLSLELWVSIEQTTDLISLLGDAFRSIAHVASAHEVSLARAETMTVASCVPLLEPCQEALKQCDLLLSPAGEKVNQLLQHQFPGLLYP